MDNVTAFEKVPKIIDFFISHPGITRALTGRIGLFVVVFVVLTGLYASIAAIVRRKRVLPHAAYIACLLCLFGLFTLGSRTATMAINPMTQQIIAANVYDKAVVREGLSTKYYFIVRIEDRTYGVITNETIFNMPMYRKNAPFDYSLYTYERDGKDVMYRFLRPEFKVKAQRGNLQ